jgi:hypothetical protein
MDPWTGPPEGQYRARAAVRWARTAASDSTRVSSPHPHRRGVAAGAARSGAPRSTADADAVGTRSIASRTVMDARRRRRTG